MSEELSKEALATAKRQENIRKAQEAKAKKKEEAENQKQFQHLEKKVETTPHPVTDKYIDPDGVYEFTLNVDEQRRYIPSTAKVWDEHQQRIRQVRLTSTEESPYLDEQDVDAKPLPSLMFNKRTLILSGREANKVKYLLALDANSAKSKILPENNLQKGLYTLRDIVEEKRQAIAKEEQILDAKNIVKDTAVDKLAVFLRSKLGIKVDELDVKRRAYLLAETNPKAFIEHINDPIHDLKAKFQELVEEGVVVVDNGDVILTSSKAIIFNFDARKTNRADDEVAKFILTGTDEAKNLKKTLGL